MNVQPQIQKEYLGMRLTPEIKAQLEGEAQRMRTTTTEIVRRAIQEYFKLRSKGRRPVA
jgi:predicted transcriptional regulator